MTMFRALPALLLLSVACIQPASAQARSAADSSFRAFLVRFEAATRDMMSGRSATWLSMVSREPTMFAPFGGGRMGAARDSSSIWRRLRARITPDCLSTSS